MQTRQININKIDGFVVVVVVDFSFIIWFPETYFCWGMLMKCLMIGLVVATNTAVVTKFDCNIRNETNGFFTFTITDDLLWFCQLAAIHRLLLGYY